MGLKHHFSQNSEDSRTRHSPHLIEFTQSFIYSAIFTCHALRAVPHEGAMMSCPGDLRGLGDGGTREAESEQAVIIPGASTEEGHLNLGSRDGFLEEVMRQNLR